MTVPAITGSTATSASSTQSASTVDYQSFLKLLVAQMKNQDPTKPMDSTDYVAQLATFSQVEQTLQTNNKLEQILQLSILGQADSLIGRTVTSADETITGTVEEVIVTTSGLIAVLEDGTELEIGAGVRISGD